MRRPLVLTLVLAALLVASAAFAAKPQTATASLTALAASGINGTADLRVDANGNAKIHESLSGLTAGAQYTSFIYLNSTACGAGINVVQVQVMSFTANNAGKANFNAIIPPQAVPGLTGGASLAVQQGTSVLSCGEIVSQ